MRAEVAQAQEVVERIRIAQRSLAEVVGRGDSSSGMAQAETGHDGAILGLVFTPESSRLGGAELAAEAVQAVRAAQAHYRQQADRLITEATGTDLSALSALAGSPHGADAQLPRLQAAVDVLEDLARRT